MFKLCKSNKFVKHYNKHKVKIIGLTNACIWWLFVQLTDHFTSNIQCNLTNSANFQICTSFTPIKIWLTRRAGALRTLEECGIIQNYTDSDHIGQSVSQSECPRLVFVSHFPSSSPLFFTIYQMVTVIYLDRPGLFLPLFLWRVWTDS